MDRALAILAAMRRHDAVGVVRTGSVTAGRITYPSPPMQVAKVVTDFSNGGLPCPSNLDPT